MSMTSSAGCHNRFESGMTSCKVNETIPNENNSFKITKPETVIVVMKYKYFKRKMSNKIT